MVIKSTVCLTGQVSLYLWKAEDNFENTIAVQLCSGLGFWSICEFAHEEAAQ